MKQVFIVSGVRTAVGDFGGALKDVSPGTLSAKVTAEAVRRAGLETDRVGHVVFGQVNPTEPADAYLARVAAIGGGLAVETPALTLNRLCGSGLQAVISAAQLIMLGDADTAVAGGAESMSRAPYSLSSARFGVKMGDTMLIDTLTGVLTDPFNRIHMGLTAENVAARFGVSRQMQDELALASHRRAAHAIEAGYFRDQILPITVKARGGETVFDTDEHVRKNASLDDFAALRPAFQRDGGTVTAGNASGINDGAAALTLASETTVASLGLRPLARLVAYAHAGVDPAYMGIGPLPATRAVLHKARLTVADMDVIEANEAFAAQACAVARELEFDPERVNPNGSGIAIGHPIGATGAINTVKAIFELQRIAGRYALVTMCIGGGQGIAAVFERA